MGVRLVVGHDRYVVSMTDLLVLSLLIGAASYRVWRLLAHDHILNPLRAKIPVDGRLEYFVGCPWCLGTHLNIAAVVGYTLYTGLPTLAAVLVLGAATVVTGVLGDRL